MGKQLQISESLREASAKLAAVIGVNPLEPVFQKAEVVIAVREWLQHPEVLDKVRQLKNTPSGFQTDEATRSAGAYDDKTLAIAVCDALASGFQLVGNEFNIISGRMMGVLNGYSRLCREWKNGNHKMAGMDVLEGDIKVNGPLVTIPMKVSYVLEELGAEKKRTPHTFERTIQIRSRGEKDGPDAWIGKATRRVLKKLHVHLTGNDFGDDLGDEGTAGASAMPPEGKVNLAKEKPAAAPAAEDASWSPVEAGAPAAAAEKPYAEMSKEEKKAATAKAHTQPPPPSGDVF